MSALRVADSAWGGRRESFGLRTLHLTRFCGDRARVVLVCKKFRAVRVQFDLERRLRVGLFLSQSRRQKRVGAASASAKFSVLHVMDEQANGGD